MMNYRGAIFDLDGVLADTVAVAFRAWQRVFELQGIHFDESDYPSKVVGRTRGDGVRAMMARAPCMPALPTASNTL